MEQNDFIKKFLAGLFLILCLGGIGVVIFVIGIEKGLTQPKFQMTVVFSKVGGLTIGAPVRLSGVTVGTVKDIGVLGEKVLEITTSPGFRRTDLSRPVIGIDPLDVQNLTETFGDAAGSLLQTSKAIDDMIREIKDISGSTKRLLNRVEQRVIDGNLFKVF